MTTESNDKLAIKLSELPANIILRYPFGKKRASFDTNELEIFQILFTDKRDELPFKLHPLLKWPESEKDRAMILMKAGVQKLLDDSKEASNPKSEPVRSGAEANPEKLPGKADGFPLENAPRKPKFSV